ncbi:Hypothetical predicted protein [Mytilus galloprovincialis]|uniref:Uncharacterized protein n=1 Tax=Mytilus galloprovincialis TaxID=29158 RepID=A0A8B6GCL9_MYTGA|nr:Hypothetical predicted protein [Mytilus galloprovincialis]
MPDIFEPLMKPGSITLNQLYEAVGCIERGKRPMTNSFIAVKQQHSSHLVDNDKSFTNIRSFNLDFTVNSVVCPYDTDAMLVLADSELKLVSANGSYKDFVIVQYDTCHVKAVGQTQNNIYFTVRKNEILCVFRYSQSSEQIEELNVKVTFTDT